jgi:hypothetical protein
VEAEWRQSGALGLKHPHWPCESLLACWACFHGGRCAAGFYTGLGLKQPSKRGRAGRNKAKAKPAPGPGGDGAAGEEARGWRLADDEVRDAALQPAARAATDGHVL